MDKTDQCVLMSMCINYVGTIFDSFEYPQKIFNQTYIVSEYSKGLKFQLLNFKAGIHRMLVRMVNREDPVQNRMIWVCAVCLYLEHTITHRPPDKSAYWKSTFFISHPKHMLWYSKEIER